MQKYSYKKQLYYKVTTLRPSACLSACLSVSVRQFEANTSEGMKMEKVQWNVSRDKVVVGVGWVWEEVIGGYEKRLSAGTVYVYYFNDIR